MPSADDRMDALTEAILSLRRRLERLEARLSRLETAQGIVEPPPPEPAPPPPPPPAPQPVTEAPPPPPVVVPAPTESPRALETQVGLTWISRVAAVTLVFAAAFFFKYAVDNQWIGEAGRVVLGVLAGFGVLGFAEGMWRRGHRIYAQAVTALGISILYLSFYAASPQLYGLVSQAVAFLLMVLVTAMAAALALRYDSLAIAVLGLVGGFLTPVMLGSKVDRPWVLFNYLLLLDVGALAVARARRWRPLPHLGFAGTMILYWAWFAERFNGEKQLVATVFALAFYALFATRDSTVLFLLSQGFATISVLSIWAFPATPFLWLALALAAAGLALAERHGQPSVSIAVFGIFWAFLATWYGFPANPGHTGAILAAFTAGFFLFLGWTAWRLLIQRVQAREHDLAVLALNGACYFGMSYHLLDPQHHAYMGLFAAALGGLHLFLGLRFWNAQPADRRDVRPVLLLIGVALCFLTLAAPIQFSSYRITMAWAVEAAALAWIGVRTGSRRFEFAALCVFLLTLTRLYAIDAWIYPDPHSYLTLANARFLTFLTTAVALGLTARWLRDRTETLVPYVAGHFVLLWALGLEVMGWAWRNAEPINVDNVQTVGLSVLMAAYGVILVTLGVLTRTAINRILGLILLAAVVAKLYLLDVWQLGRLYRIVAFSFLGILLLATSYLYSRYRTKIEGWLRNDQNRR
jgi:uncharacterized membrane protein